MEGRRCRTYSTSVWRLISQTDRTTSCVKRRVLAGRSTSTTADSATQKGDSPPPQPPLLQQDWESSPPRCRRYPQRTKQTVPSRNGALENQATPLFSDMEEFPLLHRQTTGRSLHHTGIHRELKRLNNCQYREGHPPQGVLPPSSAADLKTAATATPGRPLHRHLEMAPVQPPLPAPAAPSTSNHPYSGGPR